MLSDRLGQANSMPWNMTQDIYLLQEIPQISFLQMIICCTIYSEAKRCCAGQ